MWVSGCVSEIGGGSGRGSLVVAVHRRVAPGGGWTRLALPSQKYEYSM